jgi:asparagine synthase (glutamine-hydrolysing)
MGFGVPLGAWFRGDLRGYIRDVLLAPDARYREMLSGPFIEDMLRRHLARDANVAPQLWSVVCFERWLQMLPEWRRQPGAPEPRASLAC